MNKLACVLLLLAAAACGGSKPQTQPQTASKGGVPCAQEVQRVCGAGTVDGCAGDKTLVHVCVATDETAGPPCSQEVAKQCPDGQVDACLQSTPTATHHLCVLP